MKNSQPPAPSTQDTQHAEVGPRAVRANKPGRTTWGLAALALCITAAASWAAVQHWWLPSREQAHVDKALEVLVRTRSESAEFPAYVQELPPGAKRHLVVHE